MTDRLLVPDELALHRLVNRIRTTRDLLGELKRLLPKQHAPAKKPLSVLRGKATFDFEYRYVLPTTLLDTALAQVAAALGERPVRLSAQDKSARTCVVKRLTAHGKGWVREFVAAAPKKVSLAGHIPPLLDPLIDTFELPPPDAPRYWLDQIWIRSVPVHHCYWGKRSITAYATSSILVMSYGDRATYSNQVVRHARNLCAAEPTDDPALLRALLQIFGRGDRIGGQRIVMLWLGGLGLIPLLLTRRTRVIAALPNAGSVSAKLAIKQLFTTDLSDVDPADLTLAVLPHSEKGLTRIMVKTVARLTASPQDLLDAIQLIATNRDTTNATLIRDLLEHRNTGPTGQSWPSSGGDLAPGIPASREQDAGTLSLWHAPVGRCP